MKDESILFIPSSKLEPVEQIAGYFLSGCFLLFFGMILLFYRGWTYIIREQLFSTPWFGSMFVIYFSLLIVCIVIGSHTFSRLQSALSVFLIALIIRLIVRYWIVMYPNGDMESYYEMGVAFCRGDFSYIRQTVSGWGIPDFAGMAFFYGLLGKIFTPTIEGYQLAFSVINACSCLFVFLIADQIHPKSALYSALLFVFYPSNLLFSQVFSHQHLNLLFVLCCVYLMLLAVNSGKWLVRVVCSFFSGLLLLFAQYSHPSTLPTMLAVIIYILILFFASLRKGFQRSLQIACLLVCFIAGYFGCRLGTRTLLIRSQLLDQDLASDSIYYAKIAMGLNHETSGMYSAKDTALFFNLPSKEEKNRVAKEMIRERTADFRQLMELVRDKIEIVWIFKDTAVHWAFFGDQKLQENEESQGIISELRDAYYYKQRNVDNAFSLLDFFYVAAIYLFAFIGVLLGRNTQSLDLFLILIILGWASVHLLIEVQTRYRFLAMPFLCIFAGMGSYNAYSVLLKFKERRKGNLKCRSTC